MALEQSNWVSTLPPHPCVPSNPVLQPQCYHHDTPPRARAPEVEGLHAAAQILQQLVAFLQIELHLDVISELDEREADVLVLGETLEQTQHDVAYRVPRLLLAVGGCRV